jgi:hypothetical protein
VLFAFAPPTYQALAAISNGSHPEGGAILVFELALAVAACTAAHVGVRWSAFLGLVLAVPVGMLFVESLQLGVVLVVLSVVLVRSGAREAAARAVTVVLVEAATGWFGVRAAFGDLGDPGGGGGHEEGRLRLSTEYIGRNLETLLDPSQISGIWGFPDVDLGATAAVPAMLAAAALLAAGPLLLLLRARDGAAQEEREAASRGVLLAASLPVAFVGLYLLFDRRIGGGGGGPPVPNQLRYLGLIYPAVLCAAACGAGRLWLEGRRSPRAVAVVLVAVLAFPGVLARAAQTGAEGRAAALHGDARLAPAWCYALHAFDRGDARQALSAATPFDFVAMADGAAAMKAGLAAGPPELPTRPEERAAWRTGVIRQAWGGNWGTGRPLTELVPPVDGAWPLLTGSPLTEWLNSASAAGSDLDRTTLETIWCVERESLRNAAFNGDVPTGVASLKAQRDLTGLGTRVYAAGFASQYGPAARLSGWSLIVEGIELNPEDGGPPRKRAWAWGFGWGLGAELASRFGPSVQHVRIKLESDHPDLVAAGFGDGYGYALKMEWVRGSAPSVEVVAP